MKITIPRATLEVTAEEAIDLFHALKRGLSATIQSHWCRHPGVYSQQAASRIQMMKVLDCMMGGHFFSPAMADLNRELSEATEAMKKQ